MADYRMGASVHDAALQYIADNCDREILCSNDPVNYAGVPAVTLAAANMLPSDFTLEAGDVSGRQVVIGAKTGILPTTNGTATHIVLVDDTNNEILLQVPMPPTALNSAVAVDFASWVHESRDNEAG